MTLSQVYQVIQSQYFSGSPITGILEIEVYDDQGNVDDLWTKLFTVHCLKILEAGVQVNSNIHKMTFVQAGRHYVTSSGYLNSMKLYIVEEAILQCKEDMHCTQDVSFLLSKPAWGWT